METKKCRGTSAFLQQAIERRSNTAEDFPLISEVSIFFFNFGFLVWGDLPQVAHPSDIKCTDNSVGSLQVNPCDVTNFICHSNRFMPKGFPL